MTSLSLSRPSICCSSSPELQSGPSIPPSLGKGKGKGKENLASVNVVVAGGGGDNAVRLGRLCRGGAGVNSRLSLSIKNSMSDFASSISGKNLHQMSATGKSTNITWHKSSVEKLDRQELLQQKGCVIWITGLSGSGKSTLACALSQGLHMRGKLSYVLDGDNVRHGLNSDLSFAAEDRVENIRRIGEVAKLFADAGIICIASLISPYRTDRDACRSLLPEGDFIEISLMP